jgi:hypothetical protein
MGQTIGQITAGIEARIKPTLTGRDQHLGFCKALEHVNKELGPDMIVGDGEIVACAVEGRICPDCKAVMVKRRATTEAGEIRVAWVCECDPDAVSNPIRELASIVDVELPNGETTEKL